jgi:UTP--glucose-1-phosphate uridylyltransferase
MTIDPATRAELSRFGFDEAQLERFATRLRDRSVTTDPYVTGTITQLGPGDASPLTAAHRERGLAAVRAGQVGVVILAGGMATRFGGVVKAAVPVTHGKTFLGLKVADVAKLAAPVPIYVMTSFATHDRIDQQIRDEKLTGVETFPQLVSLRLTPGGDLFHEADGSLSPYATGHGDLTFALRGSGILGRFRARGGKLLFMSNVDNLGATLDPAVIGAHIAHGAAITAEVVRKEKGDKGGAPALLDGLPQIIEAFRFPPSFDQDSIPLFNTNTFVFDAAAIDRDFDLTFFRVEKKVDEHKVVQFERLVGQLTAFLPSHFLEVPRSGPNGRFQPVKDPEELEHRRGDIETILRAHGII